MAHGFLAHHAQDDVGVATRDLHAGEVVEGVYMDSEQSISITLASNVPLGHKVALKDLPANSECREYNEIIGRITADIAKGELVHVHNIKSIRWA